MTRATSWTDEDIATVERLWNEGLSASEIAAKINAGKRFDKKTRNAVIGKVHRLGLSGRYVEHRKAAPVRASITSMSSGQKSKAVKKVSPLALVPVEPLPAEDTPPANLIALVDLDPHQCKWVYGDPKTKDHGCCGKQQVIGLPYCIDHARRAFQPAQTKPKPVFVPGKAMEKVFG